MTSKIQFEMVAGLRGLVDTLARGRVLVRGDEREVVGREEPERGAHPDLARPPERAGEVDLVRTCSGELRQSSAWQTARGSSLHTRAP